MRDLMRCGDCGELIVDGSCGTLDCRMNYRSDILESRGIQAYLPGPPKEKGHNSRIKNLRHAKDAVYAVGLAFLCLLCYALGHASSRQTKPVAGIFLHQNSKLELVDVMQLDSAGNEIAHWYAFPSDRIDAVMISPDERWKGAAE